MIILPLVATLRTPFNGALTTFLGINSFHGNEAWLINVHIPKYKFAGNLKNYEPERSRKLLLKKSEITYLRGKAEEKGLTVIPLSLYNKGRHLKLEMAVVRGKKKFDKRETIKKREVNKEMARKLKSKF
jgi:SsrA-binding protein